MEFLQVTILLIAVAIFVLLVVALLLSRPGKKARSRRNSYIEGLKSLAEGDDKEALNHLKLAISEEPDNLDTFLKLSAVLRKMGRFDKALQIDQQLTVRPGLRRPTKKDVCWSLAQDYIGLGKTEKAISLLKELTTFDRRDTRILETLLSLYEKQEKWDEALQTKRLISDLSKTKDSSLLALYYSKVGARLLEKGDKRGESLLRQALRIDEKCVPALLSLGDASYGKGEVRRAIETWRKVVEDTPEFAFLAFDRLGKAYFDQGRFGEMEKIYEAVLQKEPRNVRALAALARIHEKKGDREGALEMFNRILDVDPSCAFATAGLMRLQLERGDMDKAAEHAKTLSEQAFPVSRTYSCSRCGYDSSEYLWHCPQCKEWKTFRRVGT